VGEVCYSRGALSWCAVDVRLRERFATSWQQPGLRQSCIRVEQRAKTYLLRLGMHGQPIRIEAFVIRHGGSESSCICEVESKMAQCRGLIYECDTKLQLLGEGRLSSGRQVTLNSGRC
jgi:hypothetical protein